MIDETSRWISEQGYPLEMRAAKIFRETGFEVRQSQLYTDMESGKRREIDLIVISPDYLGVTQIIFTAECKSSKKPWVLFTSNVGAEQNVFFTYSLMTESTRKVLADNSWTDPQNRDKPPYVALFDRLQWLRKKKETAYSFRQAFTDKDNAYSALLSSIKAASHIVRINPQDQFPHFRLAFPLVIIDSPLLLCGLNSENELDVREVRSGEILFTNPDQDMDSTCIRIVTLEGLSDFAIEARAESEALRHELKNEAGTVWQERFGTQMPDHFNQVSK